MKINYLLSDTTKDATKLALMQVVQKAKNDIFGNFVVLVPETKSIIIEKELLELSESGAFANVFVYSFVRLINRMGFVNSNKIVNKQTCVMLIRKIIYENFSKLRCYKKSAKLVGFAEKIYDTIQQFKSSNVTVDELKQALAKISSALKIKLEDIVLIYEEYQKALENKFIDDCDKLNLLGKFATENKMIKESEIFVVGFDNITFEMVSVLKALAINAKEITFSCCYFNDKRSDSYIQDNQLYKKFKMVAEELKYPYVPTFVSSKRSGDFYAIQHGLFSVENKQYKSKGSIEIFEAKNRRQEIDYVANKIISEIQDGKRFKDIGLFVNGLEENVELIKKCFECYNIPYFVNENHNVISHPLIAFIKNCFELFTSHLSYDKVLKFLSCAFVDEQNYSSFENYIYKSGLNYNLFLKELNESDFDSDEKYSEINAILTKFRNFYFEFSKMLENSKKILDFVNVVNYLFDKFVVSEKLENISSIEKSNNLLIQAEISKVILNKCRDFNDTLVNFMGDVETTLDEFLQIYLSGVGSIKINLSPISIDAVVVQENTDGFYGIKTMFILAAEEGKFPAKIQDSGIILDDELLEAKMVTGKAIEPSVSDVNARELFRVYEALLEPSEKLFISYSLSSIGGSVNEPSRIVKRLDYLFGKNIIIENYKSVPYVSKLSYENRFAKHINAFLNDQCNISLVQKEYNVISNDLSDAFKKHLLEMNSGTKEFKIDKANELFFTNGKTSISQLEKYFECPYLFFITYGLRLKENKNAKISSLDIGSIVHKIVEVFVKNLNKYAGLSNHEFDESVSKLSLKVFDDFKINKTKNLATLNFILDEVKRLCRHLLNEQENSSFKAFKNEFTFAGQNAIHLTLDNGACVDIEGKIDRIDTHGSYVRIIDYKTGDVSSDLNAIYYGKKIQLISYLSAVKNGKVAGIFYFPIHSEYVKNDKKSKEIYKMQGFLLDDIDVVKHMDNNLSFENFESKFIPLKIKTNKEAIETNTFEINKGQSKNYLSEHEFDDLKNYTEKLCKKAIREILEGNIEPSPIVLGSDEKNIACQWCEFDGFCGLKNAKHNHGRICNLEVDVSSFGEKNKGETNGL